MADNFIFYDNNTSTHRSFRELFVPGDLFRQSQLESWGLNNFAQLGISTAGEGTDKYTPIPVSNGSSEWKQVCSATYGGYGLTPQNGLVVWGSNIYGQLGIDNSGTGYLIGATKLFGDYEWRSLAKGATESMAAIRLDGSLWVWGRNESQQLGVGSTIENWSTPVTTFAGGNNWKQVSMGWKFTGAIKTDGSLWVWGDNQYGRLGIGTDANFHASTPITTFAGGNNWKEISLGWGQALATKTDGTLWAWGLNAYGECGISSEVINYVTVPTQVSSDISWKQVCAGRKRSAGVKQNGSLWTWGDNTSASLGIGITSGGVSREPFPIYGQSEVDSSNWRQVQCGYEHMAAIKSDGSLWVWGSNTSGRCHGPSEYQPYYSVPVSLPLNNTQWRSISIGPFSSFNLGLRYDNNAITSETVDYPPIAMP